MIANYPLGHVKVSSGDSKEILDFITKRISGNQKTYCIPLNLTKYVMSKRDVKLQNVIQSADLIISDGFSIVLLSKRAGYRDVHRITGIDLAEKIIFHSKERDWKIFFLGATPENLNRAIVNLKNKFNSPYISGSHHGYFKQNEVEEIVDLINRSNSDVLLLGLGLPQKEYFIYDHMKKLKVKFCLAVGGTFDVWAGVKKRTPKIVQKVGLEWLYRSFYDKSRGLYIAKYGLIYLKEFVFLNKR